MKSFRLFTTKPDGVDAANSNALSHGARASAAGDEPCEAMVATENLPNEPLMPRSHKSSARSFLKNMGHSSV